MVRRLIATVVAIIVIGGCSASSPTPGPSDSTTVPPSPGGTPGAADPSAAPPETVNLTVATEDAAAVVGSIGPGGGQLSTSAADGTTYTLAGVTELNTIVQFSLSGIAQTLYFPAGSFPPAIARSFVVLNTAALSALGDHKWPHSTRDPNKSRPRATGRR